MSEKLFELVQKQLTLLKQFKKVLIEERDAIISFSLEGIISANNMKEELLKKLDLLDEEQKSLSTEEMPGGAPSPRLVAAKGELEATMKEVKAALDRNMRLLTFSMEHVKSSIEGMVRFINKASYGRKKDGISVLVSKRV